MTRWTDRFVADRMAVDREFGERLAASEFSSQEWGTIMTAVEFEIEDPESPEDARIVADTSQVDQVLPALEEMRQNIGAAAGGAPRGGSSGSSGGGLLSTLLRALGVSDERSDRAEAAAALAEEYARQFQDHLEREGKWERACEAAAAADGEPDLAAEADRLGGADERSADDDEQPADDAGGRSADDADEQSSDDPETGGSTE